MLISTQTDAFAKKFGDHDAIKYLAQVGFDAFDYSMFNLLNQKTVHPLMRDDYKEYAQSLRRTADEHNIICNQAHAPFPSYVQHPSDEQKARNYNGIITPAIVRSMEAAAILGAKMIVVHPVMTDNSAMHRQKEMNIEFYGSLLPYCKKFNIQIALENMFGWDAENKKITPAACSTGAEFCEYLDALNKISKDSDCKDWFAACLDLGHGEMQAHENGIKSGKASSAELIHALGHRLKSLHIQDGDKIKDVHTLPFLGKINWDEIMNALKAVNYGGELTLEADAFLHGFPAELFLSASALMLDVGRYFARKYFS